MCDTLVAIGNSTVDGSVILAKNSDREPNEAQALTYVPHARHAPGSTVRCTYIEIPQAAETNELLLCRPFWMWGAEMGTNEHGVAIGNEAVFTREAYNKEPALTGMDLLRLGLERARAARQALDVIVGLLELHGQGGNCGFRHKLYYHNSFLIADPVEAWVLETVGKHWAAERVRDVRTISNGLTIGTQPDVASAGLATYAAGKGRPRGQARFSMAGSCSDPFLTTMDGCRTRRARSTALLEAQEGCISPADMMAALRDHGTRADGPTWDPGRGWLMDKICVHAGLGPTRPSQSVGSMVAHLTKAGPVVWVTGTAAPCTSIFKPVFLGGAGLPEIGPEPAGKAGGQSLWWKHERLHRTVIRAYAVRMASFCEERDALEAEFLAQSLACAGSDLPEPAARRFELSQACFRRAEEATERWSGQMAGKPIVRRPPRLFSLAWDRFDREAGFAGDE
jgi:secernin